ncbi:hypothetical protein Tco_1110643 [Tanacetum coccineum]|uniref:Uncharacterized protein n=1 Tax=Tanacetum coccineum TaxID=301880 RepID=A0ABQ5IKV0_9ASTR
MSMGSFSCVGGGGGTLGGAMDDEEVALVDGVFDGALGDESWCFGEGVLVSSLVRSMNNYLGGMMVIFGLLKGLEVEALVDVMEVMVVDDDEGDDELEVKSRGRFIR